MHDTDPSLQKLNTPVQQSFCVLPWLHRFTNLGGEIQVCCVADGEKGHLRDDSGKPMLIQDGASETAIGNCADLRAVRADMLAARWPAACERCRVTEETGSFSRRMAENERFQAEIPWILQNTRADGSAPLRIRSRDYRLGNLCNLKCRMCSPDASVMLIDEWNIIKRRKASEAELEQYRNVDWFKNPAVWEAFRAQVHELRHLHFAGGEPLITPETLKAVEICIEEGCAENIELTFNTNVTKLPRRMTDLWPRFRGVTLLCSIDAFGALNDYIRSPSRWSTIDANLKTIDRMHSELNVTQAEIHATIQVYNILYLDQLVEYCHREFGFIRPMPFLIYLTHPEFFDIQILPNDMKERVRERLGALEDRLRKAGVTEGFEQLHGIVAYMDRRPGSLAWVSEFRRVTAGLDRSRREKLVNVAPELAPLLQMNARTLWGQLEYAAGAAGRLLRSWTARAGLRPSQ